MRVACCMRCCMRCCKLAWAKRSVESVSSALKWCGEAQHSMHVFVLPPSESCSMQSATACNMQQTTHNTQHAGRAEMTQCDDALQREMRQRTVRIATRTLHVVHTHTRARAHRHTRTHTQTHTHTHSTLTTHTLAPYNPPSNQARTHARTHTRTHAHTHARTHNLTFTHTTAHSHAHSLHVAPEEFS